MNSAAQLDLVLASITQKSAHLRSSVSLIASGRVFGVDVTPFFLPLAYPSFVWVGPMPLHVIQAFSLKVEARESDASNHCFTTGPGTSAMTTRASFVCSGSTKDTL